LRRLWPWLCRLSVGAVPSVVPAPSPDEPQVEAYPAERFPSDMKLHARPAAATPSYAPTGGLA